MNNFGIRSIFEELITIKLNGICIPGFKKIKSHTIIIDGKEIAISDEQVKENNSLVYLSYLVNCYKHSTVDLHKDFFFEQIKNYITERNLKNKNL